MNTKEIMIEQQCCQNEAKLAKILGLTESEFSSLNYQIDDEVSNDGLVYNYIVEFLDEIPRSIKKKIIGLEDGVRVWVDPNELN